MNGNGEIKITIKFKPGDQGYKDVFKIPARYRAWEIKKAFQGLPSTPVGVQKSAITNLGADTEKGHTQDRRITDF